jgi:two-component system response regulator YesN
MPEPPVVDERTLKLVRELLDGSTQSLKQYHLAVAKALEYLASHFRDELHLPALAVHTGVSRPRLCQLFQEEMGMSPMTFLRLLRVEASKRVLAERPCNVNDAWGASGFRDLRTYEREFKRWNGCTPSEYRKQVLALPVVTPKNWTGG